MKLEEILSIVKKMIYDYTKEEIINLIPQIKEEKILYLYAYNYNWDNGFEIPKLILKNENCSLSVALLIFYQADGFSYLMDRNNSRGLDNWFLFIKNSYKSIIAGEYKLSKIRFIVPLSKVQLFKTRKILVESEGIFVENIEGEDYDINL